MTLILRAMDTNYLKPKRIDVTNTSAYKELYAEKLRIYGHVYVKEIDKLSNENNFEPIRRKHMKNNIKSHSEAFDENGNTNFKRKLSAISISSCNSLPSLSRRTSWGSLGSDLQMANSDDESLAPSRRSSCFSYYSSSCGEEEETNSSTENCDPNSKFVMKKKSEESTRRVIEAQIKQSERFARLKSLDGCISKADKVLRQIRRATNNKKAES